MNKTIAEVRFGYHLVTETDQQKHDIAMLYVLKRKTR